MIRALVDPVALLPPQQGTEEKWLGTLVRWSRALRDVSGDIIGTVMSPEVQAALAQATGGLGGIQQVLARCGSPLSAVDVMQLIEGIRARAGLPEDVFEPGQVIITSVNTRPEYVGAGATDLVSAFLSDLGHAAAFRRETGVRVAAVSSEASWAGADDSVDVSAVIEAWEKYGVVEELRGDAAAVSENVALWVSPRAVDTTLRESWPELMEHPQLGIEVAYREFTSGGEEVTMPLTVMVGGQLVSTMRAMGYAGKSGRIKAVFHAAAYIGCGKAGELRSLAPHPYRRSASPNSSPVEREDGAKLMRGSLGTGNNAPRLMWWEASTPEILGVVGHDENPLFLT